MTDICTVNVTISDIGSKKAECVVYLAHNTVNGKCYVGVTSKGLHYRRARHLGAARMGRPHKFARALRKYGIAKFNFFVLKRCQNMTEAFEEEKRYISIVRPEYNMTPGGEGVLGYKYSAEQKKKMVEARRQKSGYKNQQLYRAVRCLTDGVVFPSLTGAARYYGLSKAMVFQLCNKRATSNRGLTFEYAQPERLSV